MRRTRTLTALALLGALTLTFPALAREATPLYRLAPRLTVEPGAYAVPEAVSETAIEIDLAALARNPERLTFELPDGRLFEALRGRFNYESADRFSWYGTLRRVGDDSPPAPDPVTAALGGYVLLSYVEGRVLGNLHTPDGERFHLAPGADGGQRLVELRAGSGGLCALDDVGNGLQVWNPGRSALEPILGALTTPDCSVPSGPDIVIDLIALYTPNFVGLQEQAARDYILMGVDSANMLLDNSQVKIQLALLYLGPITTMPPAEDLMDPRDTVLWLLDGQDEVERLRNDYGADLVSLMIPNNGINPCGAATLPRSAGGGVEVLANNNAQFTDQAYMAHEYFCGVADYTFAHEHAHNFGLQHDRASGINPPAVEPYAYGYVFDGTSDGATVMGCNGSGNFGGACSRILYLSNPTISAYGTQLGEPTTASNGGSFNACAANQRAGTYAMFEDRPADAMPSVQITAPAPNSTVGSNVTLSAFASDPENGNISHLVSWESDLDGPLGNGASIAAQLTTAGSHLLTARVDDSDGKTAQHSIRVTVQPGPVTVSFAPAADSFVWQVSPGSNYGSYGNLHVRSAATGLGRHTYLKFNVSGVTRPVQSAKLRIRTGTKAHPASRVYWIASNGWGESTITWNNAPTAFHLQYPTGPLPTFSWVELDVSPIVSGNGTYTIGLVGPDVNGLWYWSRESLYPPSLKVTY